LCAVTLNDATGPWSGVIAIPLQFVPVAIVAPAVFVETVMGVTLPDDQPVRYAVAPSGVNAIDYGWALTLNGVPAVLVVKLIGVTVAFP
jgi:hypothetical protein